jgi:hypothetical protein
MGAEDVAECFTERFTGNPSGMKNNDKHSSYKAPKTASDLRFSTVSTGESTVCAPSDPQAPRVPLSLTNHNHVIRVSQEPTTMQTIPARPTVYNGVEMRSRLEAGFAQWLDQMRWKWEYEPECFASPNGQWLPDFHIPGIRCVWIDPETTELEGVTDIYVEIKPAIFDRAQSAAMRLRMSSLYESRPDSVALLVREGTNPEVVSRDGSYGTPVDWSWNGLWPIDARGVDGPWPHEWWKGVAA